MDSLPSVVVQAGVRDIGRSIVTTEMEKMSSIVKAEISDFHGAGKATERRALLKQQTFATEFANGPGCREPGNAATQHNGLLCCSRGHEGRSEKQ